MNELQQTASIVAWISGEVFMALVVAGIVISLVWGVTHPPHVLQPHCRAGTVLLNAPAGAVCLKGENPKWT